MLASMISHRVGGVGSSKEVILYYNIWALKHKFFSENQQLFTCID